LLVAEQLVWWLTVCSNDETHTSAYNKLSLIIVSVCCQQLSSVVVVVVVVVAAGGGWGLGL
jgi:hypothetical protein